MRGAVLLVAITPSCLRLEVRTKPGSKARHHLHVEAIIPQELLVRRSISVKGFAPRSDRIRTAELFEFIFAGQAEFLFRDLLPAAQSGRIRNMNQVDVCAWLGNRGGVSAEKWNVESTPVECHDKRRSRHEFRKLVQRLRPYPLIELLLVEGADDGHLVQFA